MNATKRAGESDLFRMVTGNGKTLKKAKKNPRSQLSECYCLAFFLAQPRFLSKAVSA
jgi:hypothetical protein